MLPDSCVDMLHRALWNLSILCGQVLGTYPKLRAVEVPLSHHGARDDNAVLFPISSHQFKPGGGDAVLLRKQTIAVATWKPVPIPRWDYAAAVLASCLPDDAGVRQRPNCPALSRKRSHGLHSTPNALSYKGD